MQKITPNLWCNGNAREAADFYLSVFSDSKITNGSKYPNSAEDGLADFQLELAGEDLTVDINIAGHDFTLINAGSEFKPNPSISFMVNFDPLRDDKAKQYLDETWNRLVDGGEVLMPLAEYPFSKHYGWVNDKYGFSWQLILTDPEGDPRPFIIPSFMFGGAAQNRASEAIDFYTSVFKDSSKGLAYRYGEATGPAVADNLMFADFQLENQWFVANDSGVEQNFSFNEGTSLLVACKDQAEIDELWSQLSVVPEAEQCGWCKDKFGVSWQIVPANMDELMQEPDAFKTLMSQRKIVIAEY